MTEQEPLFPQGTWTPSARPATGPAPVPIQRLTADDPTPPGRARVSFRHHAPQARVVALQANGWWQPDPPRACDLEPVGDGWFTGSFAVPADWCCSYGFLEHEGRDDPPWWSHGLKSRGVDVVVDRTNPRRHSAGRAGERSLLDLVEGPPDAPAQEPVLHPGGPLDGGEGPDWQWSILTGVEETPAEDLPLLVLTDGEAHRRLDTAGRLQSAVDAGRLQPLAVVLVDAGPDRAEQLGMPGAQAEWIATTLIPALQDGTGPLPRPVAADPARTVVSGSSFGSLTSLFALAHAPQRIGAVIAQSTSLWRFPEGALVTPLSRAVRANPRIRLRLQAGRYEGDMPSRSQDLVDTLVRQGADARLRVHSGGHDWAWWQPRMIDELADLLSDPPSAPSPRR